MKNVKGLMVTVDDFGGFDTTFRTQTGLFENGKMHSVIIKHPTEFYRYIGGKRFLVYADEDALKKPLGRTLTLAITENGKLTNDRLVGDLFICNVGKKNQPASLTEEDIKLIRSQIVKQYFDYFPTLYIKSEYQGGQQ